MSRQRSNTDESPLTGRVALGRDPRALARRLTRGAVAIIDALDLDAASAEALADRKPSAIINLSSSVTGRFEAGGAALLVRRGVPLFDAVDRRLLAVDDGADAVVTSAGNAAIIAVASIEARLHPVTEAAVASALAKAPAGAALRAPLLAASALDLVQRDGAAIVSGGLVPGLELDLAGKDVLVVGSGAGYRAELKSVRRAVKELRMAVIVTGDAAAEVAAHHPIAVIIGPFEAVADDVISKAASVVVHGESHAVASTRLGALGVAHAASESRLDGADLGVAVAAAAGARLIVSVGRPSSLTGLLDSPSGASALLARMAAGGTWIDANLFTLLHRSRWSRIQQWLWILLAAGALAGALALHPTVRELVANLAGQS